jgi:multicomponent Na+:H+ antiporter subunit C
VILPTSTTGMVPMAQLPQTPALIEPTLQPNLTLVLVTVGLVAAGTALALDRSLVRVLLGMVLIGNGVAVLYLVVSGQAGRAPFVGEAPESISDPLPQAMVLTAIVISLATIGFLLALSYRLWQVSGTDDVPDDAEDARIQRLAIEDATSSTYDPSDLSTTTADELAGERPADVSDEPADHTGSSGRPGMGGERRG